jgi:hypothetical protein
VSEFDDATDAVLRRITVYGCAAAGLIIASYLAFRWFY